MTVEGSKIWMTVEGSKMWMTVEGSKIWMTVEGFPPQFWGIYLLREIQGILV